MANASCDNGAGRKLPRHYYTPGPMRQVNDVTRTARNVRQDILAGSADALISAGVLTAEMLPAPGKCGITWRPQNDKPQVGETWTDVPGYMEVRRQPDGRFRVLIVVSRDEQIARMERADRRDAEWKRKMDARRVSEEDRKAAEHAERCLANLAASHEEFRERYVESLRSSIKSHIELYGEFRCRDGYAMSEETLSDFWEALDDALDELRNGCSVFNSAKRSARIRELRAQLARGDESFRPFMSRLLEGAADGCS